MKNNVGQTLLDQMQDAAQDIQDDIRREYAASVFQQIAGPLLFAFILYINRKKG